MATTSLSDGFSIPLLVAAGIAAVAWTVVAALAGLARTPPRIRSDAATMELPPESPVVAGLLVNDFVVPAEVAPAILLDLAARNVVDLDEVQPGRTICRLRRTSDEPLTEYERRVLSTLRDKAVDGVVPAEALTTGPETQSKTWHRSLVKEIVSESKQRGLTHDRWSHGIVALLGGLLGLSIFLFAIALRDDTETPTDQVPYVIFGAIAVAVGFYVSAGAIVGRMGRSLAQLPTDAGRAAAARAEGLERHLHEDRPLADLPPAAVKLRGRHFAYAAAFGAAPLAVELLPMGTEDDRRAWSRFGGKWRRVRVRYPRVWPPAWGKHPGIALLLAVFWGFVAGWAIRGLVALADSEPFFEGPTENWRWIERGAAVLIIPFALTLVWSLLVLVWSVADLLATKSITGVIVRDRQYRQWMGTGDASYWNYLAVDDGSTDRIRAFRLRHMLWTQFSQGESVTAEITPRLGYVRSLTKEGETEKRS